MSSFELAAAYLSNASTVPNVSSILKLELYGLFKYITVSPLPSTSRPSVFDFTGRAKWDAWTAAGKTYSTKAEAESKYLEIARSFGLGRRRSDPSSRDHDSSLHGLAVSNNLPGLVAIVQAANLDLNTRDEYGYTPLHLAADRGHLSVVKFLLEHGADPTLKDEDDLEAHELAQAAGHNDIVQ
ncbi:ankyrin repeat-containing domain protein, partial [Favolaschia claudopus]